MKTDKKRPWIKTVMIGGKVISYDSRFVGYLSSPMMEPESSIETLMEAEGAIGTPIETKGLIRTPMTTKKKSLNRSVRYAKLHR